MGKYLQDIVFRPDHTVRKKGLLEEARTLSQDLTAIENRFNDLLPKKVEIGNKIWRFIIWLTPIRGDDGRTEVSGLCQDYYAYMDFRGILELPEEERHRKLLAIFNTGIDKCCAANNYPNEIFQEIFDKMVNDSGLNLEV